jgi:hypothetical protein
MTERTQPTERPPYETQEHAACWRRGIMHAVESLDAVLRHAPTSKRRAHETVATIVRQLDALSDFAKTTHPASYREAFRTSENRLALLEIELANPPEPTP